MHVICVSNLFLYYDIDNNFADLYVNGMVGHKDNERMIIPYLSCQIVI